MIIFKVLRTYTMISMAHSVLQTYLLMSYLGTIFVEQLHVEHPTLLSRMQGGGIHHVGLEPNGIADEVAAIVHVDIDLLLWVCLIEVDDIASIVHQLLCRLSRSQTTEKKNDKE